jgi:S-adenosylmethionine synthetase
MTTTGWVDIEEVARKVVRHAGYTNPDYGLDEKTLIVNNLIKSQSPDISCGVTANEMTGKEQGAGDSGLFFGFAVDETDEFMPLPITLAHRLARRLDQVRQKGVIEYLRPDGKTQVTVEYDEGGRPLGVAVVVVSAQHEPDVSAHQIEADLKEHVIRPIIGDMASDSTEYHINPTGRFVTGGPRADAGLTGRKIIVDTYGGGTCLYRAGHGGGCFSGKDPSKVDRSAAYLARYAAKNIVAAGLARACEIQLAYAIGRAEPVSLMVNTYGTGKSMTDAELAEKLRAHFPLKPADIIRYFDLKKPIYLPTAVYGHFGRPAFPWEKTDVAKRLMPL